MLTGWMEFGDTRLTPPEWKTLRLRMSMTIYLYRWCTDFPDKTGGAS